MTTSLLQAVVYEAFRARDVPDDKASGDGVALSAAMSKCEDEAARNLERVEDGAAKGYRSATPTSMRSART